MTPPIRLTVSQPHVATVCNASYRKVEGVSRLPLGQWQVPISKQSESGSR